MKRILVILIFLVLISGCTRQAPQLNITAECGNGECERGETTTNCPEDCNQIPVCVDKCGDGICQEEVCLETNCPCAETLSDCPEDCFSDKESSFFIGVEISKEHYPVFNYLDKFSDAGITVFGAEKEFWQDLSPLKLPGIYGMIMIQ